LNDYLYDSTNAINNGEKMIPGLKMEMTLARQKNKIKLRDKLNQLKSNCKDLLETSLPR
jgi:hypothetical protein